MTNELEFYQKAIRLRNDFKKRRRGIGHFLILYELVDIYFRNDGKFPDTIRIEDFNYRRISVVKEILQELGFFNEERSVENYEFLKKFILKDFLGEDYKEYYLIIRPKTSNQ